MKKLTKSYKHWYKVDVSKLLKRNIEITSEYIGTDNLVSAKCLDCKHIWTTKPTYLKNGSGCPKCKVGGKNNFKYHTKEFNKYGFTALKERPIQSLEYVEVYCDVCGDISNKRINSLNTHNTSCVKCNMIYKQNKVNKKNKIRSIIKKVRSNFNGLKKEIYYKRYNNFIEKSNMKIYGIHPHVGQFSLICNNCNNIFNENIAKIRTDNMRYKKYKHLQVNCPNCDNKTMNLTSNGERIVENYLYKNNIKFTRQKTFEKCKHLKTLKFDFYLSDLNVVIEYDGMQHYKPIKYFGGQDKYNITVVLDDIKNDFCIDNNISIIRIPYFYESNIHEYLTHKLKEIK